MLIKMIWGIHDLDSLPELLFSMDENSIEINPKKFEEEYIKFKNDKYYLNVRILHQEITDKSLRTFLTVKNNGDKIVRLKYNLLHG